MELVAWDVATGLAERGHNVKIITTATRNGSLCTIPRELSDCLTVEYLCDTRPGRYSRRWWKKSRAAYIYGKDRFNPHVVFSVSAGAKSVFPVLDNVPAVMQAHGTSLGEFRSKIRSGSFVSLLSSIRNFLWIPSDLLMFRHIKKIVAVGPKVRDALQNAPYHWALYKDKVVMIPNGIDTEMFRPDYRARVEIRKQFGIPETAKVLVWASRLHRQKGAHLALEAFSRFNRDNVWFLIIGDGPERIKLQQQSDEKGISDRVVFVGQLSHAKLPLFLSAGDAFVFTTISDEGLPLNLLEAMSINLPCVISQHLTKAINSIEDVEGIYTAVPTDVKGVAQELSKALCNRSNRRRAFIEKNYSKKRMLDKYEQTLLEL
jgi:glycosyltransferase involved in cell wall biosynthesis